MSNTKRIGKDNYKKSKKTVQDKLSPSDIKEKLKDYMKVKDIFKVTLKTHVRYFIKKDGKNTFRLGGFLSKKNEEKGYVILSNNNITWSVQVNNSTFWRKLSVEEIRQEYEETIRELAKENKALKKTLKQIKEKLEKNKSKKKGTSKKKF